MRNVLRSHCGHSAVRVLRDALDDSRHRNSVGLLRGAIFFLGWRTVWPRTNSVAPSAADDAIPVLLEGRSRRHGELGRPADRGACTKRRHGSRGLPRGQHVR